jgi:glycerol-3-phosphate acyltransferase PlsY
MALITRISSASALAACVAAPVIAALLGTRGPVEALVIVTAVLVAARHHANIRRLLAGTEPRIGR